MSAFQSVVNFERALGVQGEILFAGPNRTRAALLHSASAAYNIVGAIACTLTTAASDGDPNTPEVAQAGGTGIFLGLLANPKVYPANGSSGNPLAPSLVLPNDLNVELLEMGFMLVALDNLPNPGDLVTYDTTTGLLSSIPPSVKFTGSIATTAVANTTPGVDTLTVTAITQGTIQVGALLTGPNMQPAYVTALGTGKGGTGTYILTPLGQTASSGAITGTSLPNPAFSATATIAATTMTVSAVASGILAVGDPVVGTGILPGTVITAYGSGVGGTGTYTVSLTQTVTPGVTISGGGHALVPRCVVDRYAPSTPGLTLVKITN